MTTGADRAPCSDLSLQRQEPMYGTASAGSTWLMLELGGSWVILRFSIHQEFSTLSLDGR